MTDYTVYKSTTIGGLYDVMEAFYDDVYNGENTLLMEDEDGEYYIENWYVYVFDLNIEVYEGTFCGTDSEDDMHSIQVVKTPEMHINESYSIIAEQTISVAISDYICCEGLDKDFDVNKMKCEIRILNK